jgi:sirohydrochlorin cobaltochelatase
VTSAGIPPLFVVGHGTRSTAGVSEFGLLVERVAKLVAPRQVGVRGAFIELAPPPVRDAVDAFVTEGYRHLVTVPLVLVAAGHGKGDIPGAMQREQQRHPGLTYAYGRPLGPHPLLQEVLTRRIDAVVGGVPRSDVGVVLVGRGSSDPDGNAEVAKVARLLWEGRGYAYVETSFVSLAWPSVPEALERARRLGATTLVVAPYFLFSGVLPDRIVTQATAYAAEHPGLDIRVAGLLGDSDELATLVALRYDEALAGDIRMNCDTCLYRIAMPGHEHRVGAPQAPHDHPDDPAHPHSHVHVHPHG